MKPSLSLSTRQQLAFTPQIQQTIRMLQLGAKELSEEINETLQTNPLLKESDSSYSTSSSTDDLGNWLENQADQQQLSLEDHLINQLGFLHLESQLYVIVCIIISCLDDDGYLRKSTNELITECSVQQIEADGQTIQAALNIVRQLEPAGISAQNLSECLILQLQRFAGSGEDKQVALAVCQNLELLANNRAKLRAKLNLTDTQLETAARLLSTLNPAPGKAFDQDRTAYIQPDMLLIIDSGKFSLSLNPAINRGIDLNLDYITLLKKSKNPSDQEYLKKNLNNARWWINALAQRNKTLLLVADDMVRHQLNYFHQGDIALKALGLKDIAQRINMHVSTVSRAIKDKYIQAPNGIISMKSLLAGKSASQTNNSQSNQSVKVMISELIKNESSQTPLSDAMIVEKLKTRGIAIARRTVNKYREQLKIPASHLRRVK